MSGLDFGIVGKKAIVCASSKGLGFGCANALAAVGVNLVMCARGADRLAMSARQLRKKYSVEITEVACDVTTEDGRAARHDCQHERRRAHVRLHQLGARTASDGQVHIGVEHVEACRDERVAEGGKRVAVGIHGIRDEEVVLRRRAGRGDRHRV